MSDLISDLTAGAHADEADGVLIDRAIDEIQQLTAKVKEQALQLEITEASNKHLHTAIEGKNLKIEALEKDKEHFKQCYYNAQSACIRELCAEGEQDEAMASLHNDLKFTTLKGE